MCVCVKAKTRQNEEKGQHESTWNEAPSGEEDEKDEKDEKEIKRTR